ncbi:MAG: BREX-1 system adenine-specific DNA-methyltransferase PglX [Muribaculaceae bacterium]|nr:BREX-1 system adenine-specific DNA-methyltransferase PglX [Muribaculaceae bacterium]
MNTTKLKRFATEARNKLRQGVEKRLVMLGFNDAGIPMVSPQLVSGGAVWKDKPCTVAFYNGFKALEEQIQRYGASHVVEEAAYTWFNRLMAIRILTMNDLCEPALRYVGSTRTPLIVDEARQGHIPEMSEEDRVALMVLLDDDTKTPDQFAMLITAFCHNTPLIAKCFGLPSDYTDVLFPANILSEKGFIDMLNTTDFITEEDYHSSELLGWLYQFYISEKKDQVFAKKGKYDADDIPAATQIFTPNWIVKYMVQNAIGGVLGGKDMLPENQRKYYVDTPEPPTAICHDIEELKVADLACGSGHILNECFDLLYDLYISEGYTRREAIECIFTKNLTGIDIDTRAKQLATFALMFKACQCDSSLVDASLMPHIYDMSGMPEESRELGSIQIFDEPDSDNPVIAALSTHYDAIVMNPPYMPTNKIDNLANYSAKHYKNAKTDLFSVFMMVGLNRLRESGRLGMINMMSWLFLNSFDQFRLDILQNQSISSLLHLGPRTFNELSGEVVQNAAFILTQEKPEDNTSGVYFRLIDGKSSEQKEFIFLNNLNTRFFGIKQSKFESIPGRPIGYWISDKIIKQFKNPALKECADLRQGLATTDNKKYLRNWFELSFQSIGFNFSSRKEADLSGIKWFPYNKGGTFRKWYGNNDLVVNFQFDGVEIKRDVIQKYPYLNGNTDFVVKNQQFYFRSGITWSALANKISFRYFPQGYIFDAKGQCLFSDDMLFYIQGMVNSCVMDRYLSFITPALDFNCGYVGLVPLVKIDNTSDIKELVSHSISISKEDWDAHETSWDFQTNELVRLHNFGVGKVIGVGMHEYSADYDLQQIVESYKDYWEDKFMTLHANEEELNRRFIEIYGLQDELTPDVPLDEVTILQQGEITINSDPEVRSYPEGDKEIMCLESPISFNPDVIIKQFISYAVGCMMGRYRLDRPGLAIAHPNETSEEVTEYEIPGTNEKFWIDDDGIIPLMPENCGFHDNAVNRMSTFVRQTLGDQTQIENLNFIEECLGKSLEQYFIKDFWKDHKKMYQNRPIYWLFASKKGAFQVLVYVHRMNVATVERIRSRYLLPYIERLNKRIDDLQSNESTLSTKQRNQLKTLKAQVAECEEYHNRLAVVAERGIVPNLDDGIIKNHALYGDIVTKLK